MKTVSEIRRAFWEAHPTMPRKKIAGHAGTGKMYPTDTRCAFVDFVDHLARDGQITDSLANRVTL
jgi:hypothetical protein